MRVHAGELSYRTTGETDVLDITEDVREALRGSGVTDGTMTLFVPGSTASLTTVEFESGAVEDLRRAIERLAPRGLRYDHDARWGDGNGYAHVRAALLGPSLSVPVRKGEPALGTWQQIVLIDFDNRPRPRRVLVQILGS